jgi:putative ABC transport system permease protein
MSKPSASRSRAFTEGEERAGRAVCVLGETLRGKLFGGESPLGSQIRLKQLSCEVIGLLDPKGQGAFGTDQDDLVVLPLRTAQRRLLGTTEVAGIQIAAVSAAGVARAQQAIERLLRERRGIAAGEEDDFQVLDTRQIADTLSSTIRLMTSLLGAVAAVSLLVGGIGIMNVLLVSVTERTREIGIRLAIGALEREVLLQFLVEAAVLSTFGGLVGIVLAASASYGLATLLELPFLLSTQVVVGSFVFSAAIGIVFGYLPARRAARRDPIEALRHE